MNTFYVTIRQSFQASIEIEANSEEEAKEKALEKYSNTITDNLDICYNCDKEIIDIEQVE